MKNIQTLFIFFLLLVLWVSVSGQSLQFGVTGNLGVSKITNEYGIRVVGNNADDHAVSGNAGFIFLYSPIKNFSIGAELLFVQMEGKQTYDNEFFDYGQTDGIPFYIIIGLNSKGVSKTHLSYLGLPVFLRYRYRRIAGSIGLQTLFFHMGSAESKSRTTLNGVSTQSETSGDFTARFIDYGPKMGLSFGITENLWLRADYYLGFKDVLDEDSRFVSLTRKNRQLTLGLNYFLTKTNTQSE